MSFFLRPWKNTDLDSLVKFANNKKIADNLTDKFPYPYTEEYGKAFIDYTKSHNPLIVFAIDIEGQAVGGIGVHPQTDISRKNAELGYWLAEPYWGNGIISEAVKIIIPYAFQNFEINRIYARPFESNIASQRVLEKAGFTFEARFEKTLIKNGVLLDELFFAIRKDTYLKPPDYWLD
jgi:[ribosomal protein S5]-alanine N-acetyltransferase